jgi:hypothetical protein
MTEEVGMAVYSYKRTGLIDIPRWGNHIIGYSSNGKKKRVHCMMSVCRDVGNFFPDTRQNANLASS